MAGLHIICNKCGTRRLRSRLWWAIIGRRYFVCPKCGELCDYCVEQHRSAVPFCKFCGSEVVAK